MKVHEIMTNAPRCVRLDTTLVEAAGAMRHYDVGALPVCEDERVVGFITDRDIVVRAIAEGRNPDRMSVRDAMSAGVVTVFADQLVEDATHLMEEKRVRRLPVLDRAQRLVGILSLGDIAVSSSPTFSGIALKQVCHRN